MFGKIVYFFCAFGLICGMDLETMKVEMGKENDFLTELLNLEVMNFQANQGRGDDQEINPDSLSDMPIKKEDNGTLEESASAKGYCGCKVRVAYNVKTDAYTQQSHIYGYYRKESHTVNGKAHYTSMFSSGSRAIWWTGNYWMIGQSRNRGTTWGYALNRSNTNCPYNPGYSWKYFDRYRNWSSAGRGLSIWNKC